ncbi:MAG: exonuclease domain-containing protein, partial [Lentisphaerota bacterium]
MSGKRRNHQPTKDESLKRNKIMNSNDKKILIIDIETTGFLKEGGSIVEIAAVELNLDNGLMYVVFDSICRESILNANHRNAWVFNNSDLTVEMVMEAPKFEEVSRMFQEVVMQYPFGSTSYNKIFDFTFLQDRGLKFPKILPCPML